MSNRKKIFFASLIYFFVEVAAATEITLWGTSHQGPIYSNENKECSNQQEKFVKKILQTKFLPFTYESEQNVDDKIVRDYVALFMILDDFIDTIRRSENRTGGIETYYYLKYQKIFYQRIGFNLLNQTYAKYVEKIRSRDSGEKYFESFKDFELLEINYSRLLEVDPYKLVKVNNSTLMNYVRLVKEIAKLYYYEKIKNNPHYNIKIDIPGSAENNQNILIYAQPDFLFSQSNFNQIEDNGQHYRKTRELVVIYWRDFFIAQHIVKLMNNESDREFLIAFGDSHMAGVTKFLNESKNLDSAEKESIRVISMRTDPKIACHYDQVWENMFSKEKIIPFYQWYQDHGL